jgi:hypothetical protein
MPAECLTQNPKKALILSVLIEPLSKHRPHPLPLHPMLTPEESQASLTLSYAFTYAFDNEKLAMVMKRKDSCTNGSFKGCKQAT